MIEGIKSEYILRKVFKYIPEGIYLRILNHNKKLQKKLNIILDDFKKYSDQIVIEIIPAKKIPYKSTFISKCGPESAYHIYFNESTKEMERNYLLKNEKVEKIKVKIDIKEEIKSVEGLFKYCRYN